LLSAFLTVIGHAAQFMPGTDRVTVLVAAKAEPPDTRTTARSGQVRRNFMSSPQLAASSFDLSAVPLARLAARNVARFRCPIRDQ
jgi:hypothetical protein